MMEAGILTLDNLESHFNWKPEVDSTIKEKLILSVIEKTKNKLKRHPQFTIAYRCTLAYLYTLPNAHDFNEAYDFLEGTKMGLPTKSDLAIQERWLGCDFIVRANCLKLKELEMLENGGPLNDPSEELIELTKLWADDTTKAAVYAVKGVTFNCFGPMKYHVAVEAFKSAIKLVENGDAVCSDWQMFDWLWWCGFSMSRITRQTANLKARPEELEFWQKAFRWKDSKGLNVNEPLFYANFAETIMLLQPKMAVCEQLIETSFSLWQKLSTESKLLDNLVLIVAMKFCEKYPHCSDRIKLHLKDVYVFEYLGDDNNIYRQVAKLMNYEEENQIGIDILETGLNRNGDSSNIWFDLQLQSRYSKLKPDDWIRRNYSSLLRKYKPYPKNIAAILVHRSKWLFYANGLQTFGPADISVLDECAADVILAKSKDSTVSIVPNYLNKLKTVLEIRRNERPEYLAWFRYNFLQNSNINEIVELYKTALNDPTSSEKRNVFVKENLGLVHLNNRQFSEAIATLREVALLNVDCKLIFTRAVVEYPSRSLDEMCVCLDLGSLDVITIILDLLETEKKQINLSEKVLLLDKDFDGGPFFFSKVNYEICAKIQILLENENSFFIDIKRVKCKEFIKNVSDRLNDFLEIQSERPTVVANSWRWARLELTKSYIRRQSISDAQNLQDMERSVNRNILQVLHESRKALDPCIRKYFNASVEDNSHYPHAFQRMTKNEKALLFKKAGRNRTSYDRQRPDYLLNRMKKEWLPSARVPTSNESDGTVAGLSSASGSISDEGSRRVFKYEVIEGLLRDGFKEKGKIAEEILKFVAKREYHIITKEAAWHAIWIDTDNDDKHEVHARDIEELQGKWNEYRDITGLTETLTAYDAAHRAAEFAEQTYAVFVKNQ